MKSTWVLSALAFILCCAVSAVCAWFIVMTRFDDAIADTTAIHLQDSLYIAYSFENEMQSRPTMDEKLFQGILVDMADSMSAIGLSGMGPSKAVINIFTAEREAIYLPQGSVMWEQPPPAQGRRYRIVQEEEVYYFQTLSKLGDYILTCTWDITDAFAVRTQMFLYSKFLIPALALLGAGFVYLALYVALRPGRRLQHVARRFGQGYYDERVELRPGDALVEVSRSFNAMADVVEDKMRALEAAARQREDFVASFAHELKTPLTSIIGYADMLRLREVPPEHVFLAANYIFSEGKRLEGLSLKLMDLIVLRRQVFDMRQISTARLVGEIAGVLAPIMEEHEMTLETDVQDDIIYAEPDLLKTMLMNLIDNGRKASKAGGRLRIEGRIIATEYEFAVRDFGRGIPKDELSRITEAFYMVDKSRARAQNGAGLGLALCQEIATIHNSYLQFESEENVGTTVRIMLGNKPRAQVSSRRKGGRRR